MDFLIIGGASAAKIKTAKIRKCGRRRDGATQTRRAATPPPAIYDKVKRNMEVRINIAARKDGGTWVKLGAWVYCPL